MNTKKTPSEKMAQYLQQKESQRTESFADLAAEIAADIDAGGDASDNAIETLDLLSSTLRDEHSALQQQVAELRNAEESLELLGAYVEAKLDGANADMLYPDIAQLIQINAAVRNEVESLLASMADEEMFADSPVYVLSGGWHPSLSQQAVSPSDPSTASLWQQLQDGAYQLLDDISILLDDSGAAFGQLAGGLQPQTVSAGAFRSSAESTIGQTQRIELHVPNGHVTIRVQLGPGTDNSATLVLETLTGDSSAAIPNATVSLCDESGELLESAVTNKQGQVIFEELDPEQYTIRLDHPEANVEFTVHFQASQ